MRKKGDPGKKKDSSGSAGGDSGWRERKRRQRAGRQPAKDVKEQNAAVH